MIIASVATVPNICSSHKISNVIDEEAKIGQDNPLNIIELICFNKEHNTQKIG